ncbi:MAG: hypothetical protein JSS50_04940 [Proteobacteria bacterium]|nr:hypothetical protein [Pseudomonadota bacterium]
MQTQINHSPNNYAVVGKTQKFNEVGYCVPMTFDWLLASANYLKLTDYNLPNFSTQFNLNNARIVFHSLLGNVLMAKTGLQVVKSSGNKSVTLDSLLHKELEANGAVAVKVFCTVPQESPQNLLRYHMLGLKKIGDQYQLLDGNNSRVVRLTHNGSFEQEIKSDWRRVYPNWAIKDYAIYTLNHTCLSNNNSVDHIPKVTNKYLKRLEELHYSYDNIYCDVEGQDLLRAPYALALYDAFKIAIKRGYATANSGTKISIKELYYGSGKVPAKGAETSEQKLNRLLVFSASFNLILKETQFPYKSMSGLNTNFETEQFDGKPYMYQNMLLQIKPLANPKANWSIAKDLFQDIENNAGEIVKQIQSGEHSYAAAIVGRYKSSSITAKPYCGPNFMINRNEKPPIIAILGVIGLQAALMAGTAICSPQWLVETVITPIAKIVGDPAMASATLASASFILLLIATLTIILIDNKINDPYNRCYHSKGDRLGGAALGVSIAYSTLMLGTTLYSTLQRDLINEALTNISASSASIRIAAIVTVFGLGACAAIGAFVRE